MVNSTAFATITVRLRSPLGFGCEFRVFPGAGDKRSEKEALVRGTGSPSGTGRCVRKPLQRGGAGAPSLGRGSTASARDLLGLDLTAGSHLNASSSRK